MEIYLIGGAVRDEIMGVRSKDFDYTVVLEQREVDCINRFNYTPFEYMTMRLVEQGYKIFVSTPEHFTVRAQTPDRKETADFVLAREEGPYSDGRRPDWVKPGTLLMDQQRRDFTINAIAKATDGSYIDPFNGRVDIEHRIIRAVGDPFDRLAEDALRAVRALRFAVTKRMNIESELARVMRNETHIHNQIENHISDERIQVELSKMFRFDTVTSLRMLSGYPLLTEAMFAGSVSLDATMKQKGRG